ncbi:MAG: hypothetical protein ACK5VR_12165, partial [Burkholderiales bacterium]
LIGSALSKRNALKTSVFIGLLANMPAHIGILRYPESRMEFPRLGEQMLCPGQLVFTSRT